MKRIRIGEKQPVASRSGCAGRHGVILARPARGQISGLEDPQLWQTGGKVAQDRRRAVARLVVHRDDLANLRLPGQRFDDARDGGFFVANWDNGGDQVFEFPPRGNC